MNVEKNLQEETISSNMGYFTTLETSDCNFGDPVSNASPGRPDLSEKRQNRLKYITRLQEILVKMRKLIHTKYS